MTLSHSLMSARLLKSNRMVVSVLTGLLMIFVSGFCFGQGEKLNVYLIPGMGTDARVFRHLDFQESHLNPVYIKWVDHHNCKSLADYAKKLSAQIDTGRDFVLVGVSMGGMLAMEMCEIVHPKAVILVSSAISKKELPFRYRIGRIFPLYVFVGNRLLHRVTGRKRTFKDIHSEADRALYRAMVNDCGAGFLRWQMRAVTHWKFMPSGVEVPVYHIHGTADKILPFRKVKCDKAIDGGTHKMIVNHATELCRYIVDYISSLQ